ncbi:uncharacterized protein [Montipora capricornis]|uniref:uncharacterized protein n=1 Tax=Montipora capricornis TaxID=246305 RepID=UPI0035F139AE
MYSFSEIRSASIKIEPADDEPTCNGQSSQTLFAKGRPSIKEEKSSASCSTAVGQQAVSLVSKEAGYQAPSLGEISSETDVLSIQITDVQGTPCNKNGLKDDGRINQIEVHVNGLPKDQGNNEDMQPSFEFNTMEKVRIVEDYADVEQLSRMTSQDNWYQEQDVQGTPMNISNSQAGFSLPEARNQGEEMPSTLSHHPYRKTTKTSLSGFQMNNHHAVTSKVQHNGTLPGYNYDNSNDTNGTKMALIETVPLHHVSVQDPVTPSHMAQDNLRYQLIDHQSKVSYHGFQSPEDALRTPRYLQNCDAGTRQPMSANSGCNCCCHSPSQGGDSFFFPPFVAETQRPSVIMVPISWDNSASGISHVPLTVNAPYQLHSQIGRNVSTTSGYQVDSDSSDDDEDERQEKYFRMNIDGTTARFKLSKEEWERIPINTFPSGGRLLSGDWTRIFLSKVKESNPWCSLRFKNNHVRSENSRKMHSAVFFRGGAECKRPECNVKVRFVIQKERGKYVDVTYVGNVCHSSEPGGGDAVSDKRRVKRVRRTYSS